MSTEIKRLSLIIFKFVNWKLLLKKSDAIENLILQRQRTHAISRIRISVGISSALSNH